MTNNYPLNNYDVIVVGGGMVGAAAALSLSKLGLTIAVIETNPISTHFDPHSKHAIRISAIQRSSERLLKKLNVWQFIHRRRIYPFQKMHIQDWKGLYSCLDAHNLHEANLGHIVENEIIAAALWEAIEQTNITAHFSTCQQATHTRHGWQLTLADGHQLTGTLMIGADGAHSQVRQWLGLSQSIADYQQHCIVGNVRTEKPHHHTCYQHYSADGIFALLPLSNHECSIAWYASPKKAAEYLTADIATQSKLMTQCSAGMLGKLTPISQLQAFPIIRRQTHAYAQPHTLLIGDAAHTVHPQAGQGVNLGFLDVIALTNVMQHALSKQQPIGDLRVLQRVERARHHDATLIQTSMEALNWLFRDQPLTNQLRQLARPFLKLPAVTGIMSLSSLHGRLTGRLI